MGKSFDSKAKFRKASHRCKNVLEAAKLANANKTKESITSRKIGNSDLNIGKSTIPPLFNGPEMLSSASDKGKLFDETFLRTVIMMNQVSLYLFSLLEIISNCIIFL